MIIGRGIRAGKAESKRDQGTAEEVTAYPRSRGGRPPVKEIADNILTVTLDIMGERGYAGLTVDEIVARARISKSTIYSRWSTKEELAIAAFERLPEFQAVDRGNLLDELLDLVAQYARFLQETPLGSVLPGLISEASHNSVLAAALRAAIERRRQPGRTILQRAIERGELPPTTDINFANEIMMAPLVQRSFLFERINREDFRRILLVIIAGLNGNLIKQGRASKAGRAKPRAAKTARRARRSKHS
jgi:AcrR family transcriptional regulator